MNCKTLFTMIIIKIITKFSSKYYSSIFTIKVTMIVDSSDHKMLVRGIQEHYNILSAMITFKIIEIHIIMITFMMYWNAFLTMIIFKTHYKNNYVRKKSEKINEIIILKYNEYKITMFILTMIVFRVKTIDTNCHHGYLQFLMFKNTYLVIFLSFIICLPWSLLSPKK